jgi:serine/threonine-protein kinase HipA
VPADELDVWLYGTRVARIESDRGRPRLTYTQEALQRYSPGTPLLSLALPVRTERYPQGVVRGFLDGLLLEGEARRRVARQVGVAADDTYGLIKALGRDCAGAVVIQPAEDREPPAPTTLGAERLDESALARLVGDLESAPLGVGGRVRVSLAGVQDKLLLTRLPDGSWGRPVVGTPSTHILKPEIAAYPDTVANEAFCMRIASALGLEAAHVETAQVGGWRLLVVQRYDRRVDDDGTVHRIHQEDFCQATGTPPSRKYQEDGGPSLVRIAGILGQAATADSLDRLLRAVTLNVVVGNGDAHAKNFSLLHEEDGRLRLAPAYDVMSTTVYGDQRLAMYVDSLQRTERVTVHRLVAEGSSWGMSRRRATEVISDLLDRFPDALKTATLQTPDMPARFLSVIHEQIEQLKGADDVV